MCRNKVGTDCGHTGEGSSHRPEMIDGKRRMAATSGSSHPMEERRTGPRSMLAEKAVGGGEETGGGEHRCFLEQMLARARGTNRSSIKAV